MIISVSNDTVFLYPVIKSYFHKGKAIEFISIAVSHSGLLEYDSNYIRGSILYYTSAMYLESYLHCKWFIVQWTALLTRSLQ